MASFCSNCGAPVTGQFCTACGAPVKTPGAPAPPAGPAFQPAAVQPRPARTSSLAKILFIVLGFFLLLGAIGVGGLVYVGYRAKQKITELKKDYGIEAQPSNSSAPSLRTFPPSQGSGCSFLQGQEAAQILGVAVDRAELEPNGAQDSQMCRYWVSAAERQRLIRQEITSGFANLGKADTKSGQADVEKLIGGAAGAINEANGYNKNGDYAFSLQVWRKDGKAQWDKMETAQSRAKDAVGADVAGVAMQSIAGVGDRAIELPAGHSIMVLKGDTFFLLGFQQFVPGREKTIALARLVAGRL
jgi:hypothetical protein